jgi:histone-lysine N-methyltransferase SETMAR
MDEQKKHIRHCMLYEFDRGSTAAEATKNIHAAYGEEVVGSSTCCRWFNKFRSGDITLMDKTRSGRPVDFDDEALQALLDADPRQTTRELAEQLSCSHKTVERHLHALGKVHKYGRSVPRQLSTDNLAQRASICASLLFRQRHQPFLEQIITGDEKWVCYVNVRRRRQWLDPGQEPLPDVKSDSHVKKIMLCVWWDMNGVIYFEFLDINQTITADIYSQQLQRLHEVLLEKRLNLVNQKDVILLHDNATPHVAKLTQQTIEQFGWEALAHPSWSPDLAPSGYHLFLSLRNYLQNKYYEDFDELKSDLTVFLESQPASFFKRGIELLSARWAKVVENNDDYIVD